MKYVIQNCTENQLPEILTIFNDAILNSTALYDYKVRTMETMQSWFAEKRASNSPVLGAFSADNQLIGFVTFTQFRARPAYKYTVEHSVYVRSDMRGYGIGKKLLQEIIKNAVSLNVHVLVGVIDTLNDVSIKLHESEGFKLVGIMNQVGFKFGKWLDAAFYQLILNTPENPKDDN